MSILEIPYAELAATAVWTSQFPTDGRFEFAFAGKSNVGKSSLINAMLNRKALARASKQPGKTRTINFYETTPLTTPEVSLYVVDLPGYGFAKISKSESAKWGAMVEGYLKDRPTLKRVFLLMDIRHEPNANDRMLYDWCLYYHLPVTLIATKSDKIKKSQLQKQLAMIRRALSAPEPPMPFSSESKDGREALWAFILSELGKEE